MNAKTFQLVTIDGATFTEGDPNSFPLGDPAALLESVDSEGDFVVLKYGDGLTVSIPEHQVRYLLEFTPGDADTTA